MATDSANTPRRHAASGPPAPQLPEPTYAERTRTLFSLASIGTLSTMSRKCPGFPFGSLMPYALDHAGRPIFLISSMAMHTQNLHSDPRCSLFLTQAGSDDDPLGAARATLVGEARPVPPDDVPAAREIYLAAHPNGRYWVDFSDFAFYRLQPVDVYYVGGFGVMGWVEAADYARAAPDPLATSAAEIIAHMNADHEEAMVLLARVHAHLQATEAAMTSVDRLGFTLRLKTEQGMKGARINFPGEVSTPQQTRKALVAMVQAAREQRA
jgi:putative heme iron utilization protein